MDVWVQQQELLTVIKGTDSQLSSTCFKLSLKGQFGKTPREAAQVLESSELCAQLTPLPSITKLCK